VIGEWKSTIGQMQNLDNGIYIGGGTGIADGVIIDGSLIDLNNIKGLPKSWEINIDAKDTVESCLSPAGMIRKYNETNETNIETLVELSNENSFSNIIDLAIEAFLLLVKNRSQYFEMRKKTIQTIVIGQRLGQFLEHGDPELKERFQKSTDIPIKLSSDRRTAALGAAMLIAC
jgi:predicted NBD/HSP70 family sugar kinase